MAIKLTSSHQEQKECFSLIINFTHGTPETGVILEAYWTKVEGKKYILYKL